MSGPLYEYGACHHCVFLGHLDGDDIWYCDYQRPVLRLKHGDDAWNWDTMEVSYPSGYPWGRTTEG